MLGIINKEVKKNTSEMCDLVVALTSDGSSEMLSFIKQEYILPMQRRHYGVRYTRSAI